jgi:hypothetical protein
MAIYKNRFKVGSERQKAAAVKDAEIQELKAQIDAGETKQKLPGANLRHRRDHRKCGKITGKH